MSKDRDYIKELFDGDGIKAPESLSEESMLAMLEERGSDQIPGTVVVPAAASEEASETGRFRKRRATGRVAKRVIAIAASVTVALFGITGFVKLLNAPPDTSANGGELYTFKSEDEIRKLLKSMDSQGGSGIRLGFPVPKQNYGTDEMATEEAGRGVSDAEATGNEALPHSDTYLQVEEVDEADIVKTDGKYIYYVNADKEVVILSAKDGKTEKVSVIGNNGIENYIEDIYVKGDRLITVGTVYRDDSDDGSSAIVVYDISDRSKPSVLYDFSQTGRILSSRMVGDCIYLVTNDYVYDRNRTVPLCGSSENMEPVPAPDICCVPEPVSSSYIVLSAVDVSSGEKGRSSTKAILGCSSDIYCNDHNLYVVSNEWDPDKSIGYTRIARASLDVTKVKFNRTARVRGYVNNQFSMNEREGYFYVATTSERAGLEVNNLFVLDSDLKETGKVTGFARDESIKAVRYIGDKAYVITYEQIDPLFIIDLSDPEDPRIEGEVMIDGFSSLLIPVSSGRLLGIGHATGDNGYGGEYDSGLKLALFDISDPSQPKVLDSKEFEDMSSPAQFDHHALTVNSEAGYFAVPYEIWRWADAPDELIEDDAVVEDAEVFDISDEPLVEEYHETGMLVFSASDSLDSVDKHKLGTAAILRGVYIGDWIYALDGEGNVSAFRP